MSEQPNSNTMPDERETIEICKILMEAYEDGDFLGVIVTDNFTQSEHIQRIVRDATQWDRPTKIFRGGVQLKGGGKVIVVPASDPSRLMGLRPTKMYLTGMLGEMYYWMLSMDCPIVPIA